MVRSMKRAWLSEGVMMLTFIGCAITGGTFYNPEFGVTGRIRIIVSGKRQTVYLSGSAGHATFSMQRR